MADFKGRLIAYVGGASVSVSSEKAQSAVQTMSDTGIADILTWSVFPGVSFGSLLTIIGAVVVLVRLVFDVWSYFDARKLKREESA